jgi:DNA-binding response OmpR family regulator
MSNLQTVLLVDDETNIRLMLRTTLQSVGYTILEASNGREALDIIDKRHPDVMVLDLSMPQLDGMGVLTELKNVRPDKKPRIVILTAYGSISAAVRAIRLGAIDFLEKPISPDEVRESVEAAFAEPIVMPGASLQEDPLAGGYAGVLDRVRKSLRLAKYTDAETLLMKAADLAHKDAAYFNLLGVLYESQRQWRLAKKFYGKAIGADKRYEPAQKNLRRIYELTQFGSSREPVTLGDESDVYMAKLPN